MKELMKKNRLRIDQDLSDPDQRKNFTPAMYAQYQVVVPVIFQYAHGKLIDIGCGDMPFKKFILKKTTQYDTIDVERRVPDVKFIGDIQNMAVLNDQSYDTAVCLEVLEHVPDPFKAMSEIHRIVKKDGCLILSVPHLSRLHEEPHDYFRYTKYGLQSLIEKAGFKVVSIVPQGGLFCFLGHQFSTLFFK